MSNANNTANNASTPVKPVKALTPDQEKARKAQEEEALALIATAKEEARKAREENEEKARERASVKAQEEEAKTDKTGHTDANTLAMRLFPDMPVKKSGRMVREVLRKRLGKGHIHGSAWSWPAGPILDGVEDMLRLEFGLAPRVTVKIEKKD